MSTTVKNAIAAIKTRLQQILVTNSYNTDAGNNVFLGKRSFDEDTDTFPLITIFSGSESIEKLTYRAYRSNREIIIEGYIVDGSTPTNSIEDLIEDIQKALEQSDETIGGLVNVLDYEGVDEIDIQKDGSKVASVQILYSIEFDRTYGT